jgi:hypothetical protein
MVKKKEILKNTIDLTDTYCEGVLNKQIIMMKNQQFGDPGANVF